MQDITPAAVQRNSRTLLFRVTKDGVPFELDEAQAIFVMKTDITALDSEAVLIKRTEDYPGGEGDNDQVLFVSLSPPYGGDNILWGVNVFLTSEDLSTALTPGQYYVQLDIVTFTDDTETDRFTAVQGYLTIEATGISSI